MLSSKPQRISLGACLAPPLIRLVEQLQSLSAGLYWTIEETSAQEGIYCFGDGTFFASLNSQFPVLVRCVGEDPLAPLVEALTRWREAWQVGDIDKYLSAYLPDYRPDLATSHSLWVKQRHQRLIVAKSLELQISRQEITLLAPGQVEIIFEQDYKSARYQDRVLKRLVLSQHQGRWLISREEQLLNLPPSSFSVATSPHG